MENVYRNFVNEEVDASAPGGVGDEGPAKDVEVTVENKSVRKNCTPINPGIALIETMANGELMADFAREVAKVKKGVVQNERAKSGSITLTINFKVNHSNDLKTVDIEGNVVGKVNTDTKRKSTAVVDTARNELQFSGGGTV